MLILSLGLAFCGLYAFAEERGPRFMGGEKIRG